MALATPTEASSYHVDSTSSAALYNVDADEPLPRFELASMPVNVSSDEALLSMDAQSGVCATLNSSGTLLVHDAATDELLLRDHVANPHKVFVHPSGSHIIVFSRDGELYYFAPHDRRSRASLRLQAGASTTNGTGFETGSPLARSEAKLLSSSSGRSSSPLLSMVTRNSSQTLVGECVGWITSGHGGDGVEHGGTDVERVYALIGCHRDAVVLLLECAVGVHGKGPSMRCFAFPSPPALLTTLPVASVLLECREDRKGAFCMISNASQLFRAVFDTTTALATPTSSSSTKDTNLVASFMAALASAQVAWDAKEYPFICERTNVATSPSGPAWGCISVFRPSCAAPIHSYTWANSVGVLHGVLPAADQRDEPFFGCEYFIPFATLVRDDSERDTVVLFPTGSPTLVLPTAYHLVLLFAQRCIVLNQPPGLCWEAKAAVVSAHMKRDAGTGRGHGIPLTEVVSRVRFDPFRSTRQAVNLLGVVRDSQERKLYVYGDRQVWELQIEGEPRRQWRLFLARAMDADQHSHTFRCRLFRTAHRLARGQPAAHNLVQFLRGQFYLGTCHDDDEATTVLATCDWFDEAYGLLRTTASEAGATALTCFLAKRFSHLAKLYERACKASDTPSSTPPPPAVAAALLPQLAALVALTVVEKLDALAKAAYEHDVDVRDPDAAPAVAGDGETLESFLLRAAAEAPRLFATPGFPQLVLSQLEAQGRQDCALRVAPLTGQHAYAVACHAALGHYAEAVEVLSRYSAGRPEMAEVWYAHASVLMRRCPVAVVTAMLRTMFKDEQAGRSQLLDLERLLPALAQYDSSQNEVEGVGENQVVVLLEQGLTRFHCVSTAVHTFYLSILAKEHDADRLEEFISGSLFYDHNFALRECLRHGNAQACILLYKQLRLYEDAVKMALRQPTGGSHDTTRESQEPLPGLPQAEDILRGVGGKVSDETMKRLWLLTAEYAMQQRGVQAALAVVADSGNVLHLDDILGQVSDDTVVQELKGVLMASLDRYTEEGNALRRRQEEAYQTAEAVKVELGRLRHQYGYVAGHQRCLLCRRPLLQGAEPYVLYPSCQHVVHESCAVARLEEMGGLEAFFTDEGVASYVLDGVCSLAELVQVDCVVCGEAAIVELDIPLCEEDPSWAI